MAIYSWFTHDTWWFSIVFCMFTRGYPYSYPNSLISPVILQKFLQSPKGSPSIPHHLPLPRGGDSEIAGGWTMSTFSHGNTIWKTDLTPYWSCPLTCGMETWTYFFLVFLCAFQVMLRCFMMLTYIYRYMRIYIITYMINTHIHIVTGGVNHPVTWLSSPCSVWTFARRLEDHHLQGQRS